MSIDRGCIKPSALAVCGFVVITFLWSMVATAGTWRDQFSDDRGDALGSWIAKGKYAEWTVMDGFLQADQLPIPREVPMSVDYVQLTESIGPHASLRIRLTRSENLVLGLGRVFGGDTAHLSYYLLGGRGISAYRLGSHGTTWDLRFGDWVPRHPGTI